MYHEDAARFGLYAKIKYVHNAHMHTEHIKA